MTAEQMPRGDRENDNVRELRVVKAPQELSSRAVPPVLEWGPSELEGTKLFSSKPASSLSEMPEQVPDDN